MQTQAEGAQAVVDKYASLVYKLAFARTRRRDAADDIFQEVFSAMWPRGRTLRARRTPAPGSAG